MSSETLDWVARCLEEDQDVIVPLRKIWCWRYSRAGELHFQRFVQAVLRDGRFEQVYCVEGDIHMEAFGCFAGPRVKLRSRRITPQDVLGLARRHNDRIVGILLHAMEILRDDPDCKPSGELEEAVALLQQLYPALKHWTHLRPDQDGLDRAG